MKVIKCHHGLGKFKDSVTIQIVRMKFVAKIFGVVFIVKDFMEIRLEIIDLVYPTAVSATSVLQDYQLL